VRQRVQVSTVVRDADVGSGAAASDPFQPGLLPKDEAAGLATRMRRPVTADVVEENRVLESPQARPLDEVADLVRALPHRVALPARVEHLRHERQRLERLALVQRREDLLAAPDLDENSDAEI
jgi:hypothetical protein